MRILTLILLSVLATGARADDDLSWMAKPKPYASLLPLSSSGCIASGSAVGSKGEAVTVGRAETATYTTPGGALSTCAANELRVAGAGALIESPSINYAASSDNLGVFHWNQSNTTYLADQCAMPTGLTTMDQITSTTVLGKDYQSLVTVPSSTGPYTVSAWTRAISGTASESVLGSCNNGQTATNCTCGRADGAACTTNTTTATKTCAASSTFGTTPVFFWVSYSCSAATTTIEPAFSGGVYGTATGAGCFGGTQAEARAYPSSYIATPLATASRSGDSVSVPFSSPPLSANAFCLGASGTPVLGRAWTSETTDLVSMNTETATSSATLRADTDGRIYFTVVDAAGGSRVVSAAHGWTVASSHDVAGCADGSGGLSLYADGALLSSSTSGAGTGLLGTTSGTIYIGSSGSGSRYFNGYVRNIRIGSPSASPTQPVSFAANSAPALAPERYLWLSDSIYNDSGLLDAVTVKLAPERASAHDRGTYGGSESGLAMLELSDSVSAYLSGSWQAQTRGTPFSAYNGGLIFNFLRNEENAPGTSTSYRRAYDKLLAQGQALFPSVVANDCPPIAKSDFSAWDLSSDLVNTLGFYQVLPPLWAKWNANYVDNYADFQSYSAAGDSIAGLMRDTVHPSFTLGRARIAARISRELRNPKAFSGATPEITGSLKSYLFGQPTAGSWTLTPITVITDPASTPLGRVAGLPDEANVASASGAKLSFPAVTTSANAQVWVQYIADQSSGGTMDVYVDRGAGSQVKTTLSTLVSGVQMYPRGWLVADGLSAGSHQVEIETTSASPVRVIGVTYVGVP